MNAYIVGHSAIGVSTMCYISGTNWNSCSFSIGMGVVSGGGYGIYSYTVIEDMHYTTGSMGSGGVPAFAYYYNGNLRSEAGAMIVF